MIGEPVQVSIWHDGKGSDPNWFLEKVTVVLANNRQYAFKCDEWLSETEVRVAPCRFRVVCVRVRVRVRAWAWWVGACSVWWTAWVSKRKCACACACIYHCRMARTWNREGENRDRMRSREEVLKFRIQAHTKRRIHLWP